MTQEDRFPRAADINQSPPFVDVNLYERDPLLRRAVAGNGGAAADADLIAHGAIWGAGDMVRLADEADRAPPRLERFDASGFRRDVVEFHPAYHALMRLSTEAGLHNSTWTAAGERAEPAAEVIRAAQFFITAQIDSAHLCPITMTRAAVAALAAAPDLRATLMPKISARRYDPRFLPWWEKDAMTLGMGMTERQGGTDVRTNSTRAVRVGDSYRIDGAKWFMSAPMSDAFLVLAQADGGLSCFFLPRFRPDGGVNGLHFQRLKNKLGNRANASSEVEFNDAYALAVGEEGRGVQTIIQMVQLTRLDCAISSAGLMRMGLAQAIHHARHRTVFQKHLVDQPMMRAVLADMALTVAAATALVMRLARSFDKSARDPMEAARVRILTPIVKYWVCKMAPGFLYEAMECLGGNGYVEEGPLARLYREAPVNAIWEGSGNVMALDVLRVIAREPDVAESVFAMIGNESHGCHGARAALEQARVMLLSPEAETRARDAIELLAEVAGVAALTSIEPETAALFAKVSFDRRKSRMWGASNIGAHASEMILRAAMPEL